MYQSVWTPVSGEMLSCTRENGNRHNPFSVTVSKSATIVGHLSKKISSMCSLFLRMGGTISCIVTGPKQYSADLIQGGLEIPCHLMSASKELVDKAKNLLALCEQKNNKTETSEAASLNTTKSEESDSLINTQLAINGNPAKKIKLDDVNNSHTSNGDVPYNQWLCHELGKV